MCFNLEFYFVNGLTSSFWLWCDKCLVGSFSLGVSPLEEGHREAQRWEIHLTFSGFWSFFHDATKNDKWAPKVKPLYGSLTCNLWISHRNWGKITWVMRRAPSLYLSWNGLIFAGSSHFIQREGSNREHYDHYTNNPPPPPLLQVWPKVWSPFKLSNK